MKMKLIAGLFLSAAAGTTASARGSSHSYSSSRSTGEHMVSGHTTKSGTYVAPHWATNPNATRNDNYSTRGNINPHTGVEGTKPRDEDLASH
jgi:hypothetical protein